MDAAPRHEKLVAVYSLVAANSFTYIENEIDAYGERAVKLSGDARIHALWRVLYAYKTDQNEAKLLAWHDRILKLAQKEGDSDLDLLARFMYQAYQSEIGDFNGFTDREWTTYLATPDQALQNIVMVERIRYLQHFEQWADAIDLGDKLIVRLKAEGPDAEPVLESAYQVIAYSLGAVGDYDAYANNMFAMAKLSQKNAFFSQKLDMVYDLALWAAHENDMPVAEQFQKLHGDYVRKYNVEDLKTWDEFLCATIEDQAQKYNAVKTCLKDSYVTQGMVGNVLDVWKLRLLTKAYAAKGNSAKARFYLAKLRAVPETMSPRDTLFEKRVEAYTLQSEGRSAEAFDTLDEWGRLQSSYYDRARIDSVQGMYKALRKELDSKTAESRLLVKQVQMRNLLLGAAVLIALLLAVIVIGGAMWVFRMRRMQWHLRDAHEHAEAANAAKSRFLAVMSHELRTPLNGVLGMAQALKKNDLSETQREQVDILVDSGKTLLVLLNDVLDMSRIEAGKIELAPTPSTMKDMIERVINTYGSLLDGKDVMLRYELNENASEPMTFDVLRVYQCLSNLVSNALKFTEKGTVRILTSATPREEGGYRVRVEVRDTGIGMSKTTLDKLFEAFTQADAMTARKYGGTGLGLNISRRLAELMGGSLSVTSEEGAGSAFVMTFEAGEVMATEETEQPEMKTMPKHDDNANLPGMHILLVDDHPVNRKVARLFLEPFGFIITEAVDGQEALDLDMSRYDLVLMDLNMPRLGGLEATRIFRSQEPEGQHVPIVALTADAMHDQIEACHAAGMDAHISKPIIMDTLIDTVAGLLRLKEDQPDAKVEVA
ncbi:ATP-binding protein [Asticcacaulis sp.]|uniref:ATP-binding protein n=1 Tax=Asticcacaulis sp. TaxID=1872648 RepID=UPI002CA8DF78|nr:ATP-binding protein [Asticcacaulis sp.]HTM82537.1 ATP-binding protein [Asticcacaulis sp.]